MKRLIISILAGFTTTAIAASAADHVFHSTGIFPPYGEPNLNNGLMLMAFVYRALFAGMGAYITASLARKHARKAVLILGTIGSVIWLLGAIAFWNLAPTWYNIFGIVTGVPIALMGLKLCQIRQNSTQNYSTQASN